jgi:hypothetical protein
VAIGDADFDTIGGFQWLTVRAMCPNAAKALPLNGLHLPCCTTKGGAWLVVQGCARQSVQTPLGLELTPLLMLAL